jgi:hypothetical protein
MEDRKRQLRHTIAHFTRLLEDCTDPGLAETYRAEIAAAEAMLAEIDDDTEEPQEP